MKDCIESIEDDFLAHGDTRMKNRRCPYCGGKLHFAIGKYKVVENAPPGRRITATIIISCSDQCNLMLSILGGFCPAWAEEVEDWDAYSDALYGE